MGRPMIRAVRFSSVAPDARSSWQKYVVDRLSEKHDGLRFLRDDRPKDCEIVSWHEPAPPSRGFAYLEVWTGCAGHGRAKTNGLCAFCGGVA